MYDQKFNLEVVTENCERPKMVKEGKEFLIQKIPSSSELHCDYFKEYICIKSTFSRF